MLKKNYILAIDEGRKSVGTAITDISGKIPFPYKTVRRNQALNFISSVVKEREIVLVLIGLPFNVDGSKGFRYIEVIKFAKLIKKECNVIVKGIDERYSTEDAKELLEKTPGKKHYDMDSISAYVILKRFIDNEKTIDI